MTGERFGFEEPGETASPPAGLFLRRVLLLIPPGALLFSGIAMTAAIPFAWGKGTHVGLEPWMTGFSGVAFAAPALWFGGKTVQQILRRTGGGEDFTVFSLQLLMGIMFFSLLAITELVLVFRITDPRTFDTLLNDEGEIATTPTAFLMITLIGTFFACSWLSVAAFLYTQGITPASARFARRLDEPDPMDDLLRGQRPRRY
jgi:hypothetical protein